MAYKFQHNVFLPNIQNIQLIIEFSILSNQNFWANMIHIEKRDNIVRNEV